MSEQKTFVTKKNLLDEFKLRLIGPRPPGAQKDPTLAVSVFGNNPRITVWTNDQSAPNNGRINANMSIFDFYTFINLFEAMLNSPSGEKSFLVECRTGYPTETRPVSVIKVWRTSDMRYYISLRSLEHEGIPVIEFPFIPERNEKKEPAKGYHYYMDGNGQGFEPHEISKVYAKTWIDVMRQLVALVSVAEYTERPPKEPQESTNGQYGSTDYGASSPQYESLPVI